MIFIEACNFLHRAAGGWLKKHNHGDFGCFGGLTTPARHCFFSTNHLLLCDATLMTYDAA